MERLHPGELEGQKSINDMLDLRRFLTRAATAMAAQGAPVKRVMTDNAFACRLSRDFQKALAALGVNGNLEMSGGGSLVCPPDGR